MKPIKNNKVVFGGSFNPPTIAHQAIIKALITAGAKTIYLVPNGDSYQKSSLALFTDRKAMLELLITDFKKSDILIMGLENCRTFKGSIQTLRDLNHPLFAMGSDSLYNIESWINWKTLILENDFIVFSRNHEVKEIANYLENHYYLRQYQDHFSILPLDLPNVSSTEFRKSFDKKIVTPAIYDYIIKNHLYEVKHESE